MFKPIYHVKVSTKQQKPYEQIHTNGDKLSAMYSVSYFKYLYNKCS